MQGIRVTGIYFKRSRVFDIKIYASHKNVDLHIKIENNRKPY